VEEYQFRRFDAKDTYSGGTRDDKDHDADEDRRPCIMREKPEYKLDEQRGCPKGSEHLRAGKRVGVKWL
jgi:hypothetical protein